MRLYPDISLRIRYMPTVLWWGRSDPQYSRNQIILKLLVASGCEVDFFHPVSSPLGKAQAFFQRPRIPDFIWVPCFRHRDVTSACYWARKWNRPLVFDPLISAYQKEVYEKCKWRETHKAAIRLRSWESRLFREADIVVADTHAHAQYYMDTFRLDPGKICVVLVGADEQVFRPSDVDAAGSPVEVLFYGSFLSLQGPDVIVDAALKIPDKRIQWVLLGDGDLRPPLEAKSDGQPNIRFEPWIPYERLPQRLARAHILLGIFGTTPKAAMVIPNKVFQSMAVGRPLITRRSEAYPKPVSESSAIGWIPAGDAGALAAQVQKMAAEPGELVRTGRRTRILYEQNFSTQRIRLQLQHVLEKVSTLARGKKG